MRWEGREGSENIEDRRGMRGPTMAGGSIIVILIGALIAYLNNVPIANIIDNAGRQLQQQNQGQAVGGNEALLVAQKKSADFTSVVLRDTELVWTDLFPRYFKGSYQPPKLVLFDGQVTTQGCGAASSAVGPFYCPADQKVYIDLTFFDEMRTKFKAPGDFACAYVIAHEVGHHIQNLLGISAQVQQLQQQSSRVEANNLSVRLELQADFLAGVWAHHAQKRFNILEQGDIAEAIRAAQQIGDDTLQKQATGRVVPDAFTHGSSEQRIRWFSYGLETGELKDLELLLTIGYDEL